MKNKSISPLKLLGLAVVLAAVTLGSKALADEKHSAKVDISKLPPAATKANVTYATDIKPIFEASCVKCHGAEKPKAGLKLNSLEGALKGTKEGKVIEPGQSTKSALVISVACISDDDETWMPPKNNKANIAPLTKEQVGLIRAWVDQGAK
jgi:cytochrome c5